MEEKDIQYFKEKLLAEKETLEAELQTVGHKNPDNPADWESDAGQAGDQKDTDLNERADNITEYENHTAILKQLETQLLDVTDALAKIEKGADGKYGICEVSGDPIVRERLEANPSARTSAEHMNK